MTVKVRVGHLVLVSLLVLLTACGAQGTSEVTSTREPLTSPQPTTTNPSAAAGEAKGMAVYFLLEQLADGPPGPFLVPVYREVSRGTDAATTVVRALLQGPSRGEIRGTPAISTAIPQGTEVLGVEVGDGLATVDLSATYDDGGGSLAMFARLAQVVYTLTRLPNVDEVAFKIDGEAVTTFSSEGIELDGPQRREGYYDLLPPIFVEYPAWGAPVTSPVRVKGLSNVFEATSQVMLTDDDGEVLFEETVTATCGTGCWGEWSAKIPYDVDRNQFGALIVWASSAKDGSRVNIREYPVRLR